MHLKPAIKLKENFIIIKNHLIFKFMRFFLLIIYFLYSRPLATSYRVNRSRFRLANHQRRGFFANGLPNLKVFSGGFLPYIFRHQAKVVSEEFAQLGKSAGCGWVECRKDNAPVALNDFAVELADLVRAKHGLCGHSTDKADKARVDQPELGLEPGIARFDTYGLRLSGGDRQALDGRCYEYFLSLDAHLFENFIEHSARESHERAAGGVFCPAGRFSDEHCLRVDRTFAGDGMPPRFPQKTFAATPDPCVNPFEFL